MLSLASLLIASCASATENHATMKSSNNPVVQLAQTQQTTTPVGTFVSGEHTTQGTVSITAKNGNSFLKLDESFKTTVAVLWLRDTKFQDKFIFGLQF